jgi:NADPH:quinone reductase
MMRAAIYERTGPAREVLKLADLPDPEPAAGEVRVKVHWSGINPSDVKTRAGVRPTATPFPRIPHSDGMGTIDKVGAGVDNSRIGEKVWLWNAAWDGRTMGTAAQFVTLPSLQAVALPQGVPGDAAACFGIPALTAMHAVRTEGGVRGKTVLVAGGAGSVGYYAIQFARLSGAARIIATVSSAAKAEISRAAGAHDVLNYRDEDVAQRVITLTSGAGVDRVVEVDIAGNAKLNTALTRRGGEWVVYGTNATPFQLDFGPLIANNLRLTFFMVYHLEPEDRLAAIEQLHAWLGGGKLQHNIAMRLELQDIARAHEIVESGTATGNVVIHIE